MTKANTRHGETVGHRHTPEHQAWNNMKRRCGNPNTTGYARYGGRGIRVHPEWAASFEAFLSDMGRRPSPEHSLDRIDNDGNYEPGNVRWATLKEQARNQSTTRFLTIDGVTRPTGEWADLAGIQVDTLTRRLAKGWSPEQAMRPDDLRGRSRGRKSV